MNNLSGFRWNEKYKERILVVGVCLFIFAWAIVQPLNVLPNEQKWFTSNAHALLIAARMGNVLLGTGTAYLVIRIAKRIFPKAFRSLFFALIVLLPEFVFIFSYVNNEGMAIFSSALICLMWIRGIESSWDKVSCIGLAIGVSLCVLSYCNSYGFVLCSIIICIGTMRGKSKWKKIAFIAVVVFALSGWWLIRNGLKFDGDFAGSFWGSEHPLKMWVYAVYGAIYAIGLIGCVPRLNYLIPSWSDRKNESASIEETTMRSVVEAARIRWKNKCILTICLILAIIIPNVLNSYYFYRGDFETQGRFFLPMLIPLMFFVTYGWKVVFAYASEKLKWVVRYVIPFGLAALAIYIYFDVFVNTYVKFAFM